MHSHDWGRPDLSRLFGISLIYPGVRGASSWLPQQKPPPPPPERMWHPHLQLPRSLLPLALLFLAGFLPFLFYSSHPPLPLSHEVFSLEAFTVWVATNVLSGSCLGFTFSGKHICCFAWHHISPPARRQNRAEPLSIFTSNKPSVCLPCLFYHNTLSTLM